MDMLSVYLNSRSPHLQNYIIKSLNDPKNAVRSTSS
jgi:hypothetical protein